MSGFDFLMCLLLLGLPLLLSAGAGGSAREVVSMLNLEGGTEGDLRYSAIWLPMISAASCFLILYCAVWIGEEYLGDASTSVWIGGSAIAIAVLPLTLRLLTHAPPGQLLAASATIVAFLVAGFTPAVIFLSMLGSAMAGATGIGWR